MKFRPKVNELMNRKSSSAARNRAPLIEEQVDTEGRNPLHIAAAQGRDSTEIIRLISGPSGIMPAVARDNYGRFPLHWACVNPNGCKPKRRNSMTNKTRLENMEDVVFILLRAYPVAVTVPDNGGQTPLDLAREFNAQPSILRMLEVKELQYRTILRESSMLYKSSSVHSAKTATTVDVPSEIDHSSVGMPDDVSSIGWDGGTILTKRSTVARSKAHNDMCIRENSCSTIKFDKEDMNSEQVIRDCWFM